VEFVRHVLAGTEVMPWMHRASSGLDCSGLAT
jgi:hypothetical protein